MKRYLTKPYRHRYFTSFWILFLLSMAGCISNGEGQRPADAPLTDIEWQWIESTKPDGSSGTKVPTPEKFTLVFRTDGQFNGQADCNRVGGRYSRDNGLRFMPGPTTMAYCGEDSLDRLFMEGLGRTTANEFDDQGHLVLTSGDNDTQMRFRNGGVAP